MTNLPIPMGPSRQDVDSMRRLRSIMETGPATDNRSRIHEGVHSGGQYRQPQQPAPSTSAYMGGYAPADVQGMKSTLEKFYAAQGGKESYKELERSKKPISSLTESTSYTESRSSNSTFEARTRLEETKSGKTRKRYDVVDVSNKQITFEDFSNKETAEALAKFFNRGLTESDKKVREVLELEEDFNRCRADAMKFKNHYNRSIELGEEEAGAVFAKKFRTAKAEALAAQESIKSINDSIR